MMWTNEDENKLIQLRNAGEYYKDIAKRLGRSIDAVYQQAQVLKSENRLKVVGRQKSPNKFSREELLDVLRTYVSRDSCPNLYRHSIIKEFGSWTAGLKAAEVLPNCGGLFDPEKETKLYLLKFDGFYKIGVTRRQIAQRFAGAPNYAVLDEYCSDLDEILALEKEILSKVERTEPSDPWFIRNGRTECFLFPFDPTLEDLI